MKKLSLSRTDEVKGGISLPVLYGGVALGAFAVYGYIKYVRPWLKSKMAS